MRVKKISQTLFLILFTGIFVPKTSLAQDRLSLEDAVKIGLENNLGVRIARKKAEIPRLNKSFGEAGFLPNLSAGVTIEQLHDTEREAIGSSPAATNSYVENIVDADITLEWTVFDGFAMYSNYKQLKELEELGDVESQLSIERIVIQIISTYYNIVTLERRIDVLANSVEISRERVEIAQAKYDLGSGSEYDLLVAQTDYNSDKTNLFREQASLNEARLALYQLLNINAEKKFLVADRIDLTLDQNFNELKSAALQNNYELIAARIGLSVRNIDVRKVTQGMLPKVNVFASYYLNNLEHFNAVSSTSNIDGLHFGVAARWNIFNGFDKRRSLSIARVNSNISELMVYELEQTIDKYLLSTFSNYQNAKILIELEEQNLEIANKTLEIAMERFRLGNITSVELRESQRTLLNTEHQLIEAQFQAKIYETELLHLTGGLRF